MQAVSIVATELNEIGDIARVVESLLAQEPPAAEIVIVDGGSTDGTWEWLANAAAREPRLIAIRDESCSLKHSRGPVSRGRNVAIAAAKIANHHCLRRRRPYLHSGLAWQPYLSASSPAKQNTLSAAPALTLPPTPFGMSPPRRFSPFDFRPRSPRSPALHGLWRLQKTSGSGSAAFQKQVLVGEDTLFDLESASGHPTGLRHQRQKALYRPMNTFSLRLPPDEAVCHQRRPGRSALVAALAQYPPLPVAGCRDSSLARMDSLPLPQAFLLLEAWYAFHRDWRFLPRFGPKAVMARFAFSVVVPWLVAINQIRGRFSAKPLTNWQNHRAGNCVVAAGSPPLFANARKGMGQQG